jgi:hypothetical protein
MEKHTNVITTVDQSSATRRFSKMSITDQNVNPEPVQLSSTHFNRTAHIHNEILHSHPQKLCTTIFGE